MGNKFLISSLYKSQKIDHFSMRSADTLGQYLICGGHDIGRSIE